MNVRPVHLFYLFVFALAVPLVAYVPSLTAYGVARWSLRNTPEAWTIPQPLPAEPEIAPAEKSLSYFGYEFEVPWAKPGYEKQYKSVVVLNFSERVGITFFDPAQSVNELQAIREAASKKGMDVASMFGTEVTRSSYDLRKAILSITPKDLELFSSRREIAANSVMLMIKGAEIARFKGGVYSFETKWVRGFQEGGPRKDDGIVIDAYDRNDKKVEFLLGTKRGTPRLSQPEINCILYSLRPVAANEPK